MVVKIWIVVFRVMKLVALQLVTNVSEELITSIFTEENGTLVKSYKTS
jgi:hypothetical protein